LGKLVSINERALQRKFCGDRRNLSYNAGNESTHWDLGHGIADEHLQRYGLAYYRLDQAPRSIHVCSVHVPDPSRLRVHLVLLERAELGTYRRSTNLSIYGFEFAIPEPRQFREQGHDHFRGFFGYLSPMVAEYRNSPQVFHAEPTDTNQSMNLSLTR
jgi:hypothetical protein